MSAPTLTSDELEVGAETAGVPRFPACFSFGGLGPATAPLVYNWVEGPDVATLTSEIRVLGAMPEVAPLR